MDENSKQESATFNKVKIEPFISLMDLKRLEAYGNNMIDFHMIRDLVPTISRLFFSKSLYEDVRLSYAQAIIMAGSGLQHKS